MFESVYILFLISSLTSVIILIIGFFVFKLAWNDAKKNQEQNTYAPYSCDEETDTFIALSTPSRFFTILFFIYALMEPIDSFYYPFPQGGSIVLSIFLLCCSLVFSMIPKEMVISPDFVTISYPILFFTRIIKIAKRDISYISYKKKNTFSMYRVHISIVRRDQSTNRILYLFSKDEQHIINNSKMVLARISKILNVPIEPIRAS